MQAFATEVITRAALAAGLPEGRSSSRLPV